MPATVGSGFKVREKAFVAEIPRVSVTAMVKLRFAGEFTAAAIPLKPPCDVSVSHDGKLLPPATENVKVPVPPIAVNVTEYCLPEVVGGSAAFEVMETAGAMVTDSGAWSAAPAASVTIAVKLSVVGLRATGVPKRTPAVVNDRPVPASPVADQETGAVPPVFAKPV